ncbi:unnamed protein product [Lampetra fluviatilis]
MLERGHAGERRVALMRERAREEGVAGCLGRCAAQDIPVAAGPGARLEDGAKVSVVTANQPRLSRLSHLGMLAARRHSHSRHCACIAESLRARFGRGCSGGSSSSALERADPGACTLRVAVTDTDGPLRAARRAGYCMSFLGGTRRSPARYAELLSAASSAAYLAKARELRWAHSLDPMPALFVNPLLNESLATPSG